MCLFCVGKFLRQLGCPWALQVLLPWPERIACLWCGQVQLSFPNLVPVSALVMDLVSFICLSSAPGT